MTARSDFTLSEGAYTLCGDDERGYDFVTLAELHPFQELHLPAPGVLSPYLDITPQRLAEVPLER